jgi:integrase
MAQAGLSAQTVNNVRGTLATALNAAIDADIVVGNVALRAKPMVIPWRRPKSLCQTELDALLTSSRGTQYHVLWALLAGVGLRIGEATALHWESVDLDSAMPMVTIEYGWKRGKAGEGMVMGSTKADKVRTLPLRPEVVEALREHVAIQHGLQAGAPQRWVSYPEGRPVVTTDEGKRLGSGYPNQLLKKALKTAGLPEDRCTVHELRKTWATLLRKRGGSVEAVAAGLGHADTRLAERTYAHITAMDLAADLLK